MRRLAVTALAAALAAAVAPAAQANGDPASDYLPSADVFLSFSEGVRETPSGKRLLETVASANKGGYRIKVAVIATPTDLGTVGGLFGEPQRYAEFLGQEISFVYRDRLLIAMPAGRGSRGSTTRPRGRSPRCRAGRLRRRAPAPAGTRARGSSRSSRAAQWRRSRPGSSSAGAG